VPSSDNQRVLHEIADLKRRIANVVRVGSVHQVKGDKLRINFGTDRGGKEVLSPWINHTNHRGGSRERRFLSDDKSGAGTQGGGGQGGGGGGGQGGGGGNKMNGGGQNVTCICPDGDFAQAIVMPFAPNRGHKPPDHANKSGKDEETWQQGDNRYSRAKDGYDWWLEPEEKDQQQGGGGQQGGGQDDGKRKTGGEKAKVKMRYNEKGGITNRVGKDMRMAAHEKGAKLKATKENHIIAYKDMVMVKSKEPPIINKPWEIMDKPDPIPDDDE